MSNLHEVQTMSLRDYENLPMVYDSEGNLNPMVQPKVGDCYIMRESENVYDKGDVVSVYEIVRLTDTGNESKVITLRII